MNEIDEIIANIDIQQDFISSYILSGILLASLIIVTILSKSISRNHPLTIFGFFLALVLIINIDFYLCYTGLIINLPHLFNSNEFFTLLMGPALLIFINSLLFDKKIIAKNISIHLIVPMGYLFTQLGYHFLSAEVKLLYYLDSYGIYVNWPGSQDSWWLQLSHYFNGLFLYILVVSVLYYGLMSIKSFLVPKCSIV